MANYCENRLIIKKKKGFNIESIFDKNDFDFAKIVYGSYLMPSSHKTNLYQFRALANYLKYANGTVTGIDEFEKDGKPFTIEMVKAVVDRLFKDLSNVIFGGAKYEIADRIVRKLVDTLNGIYYTKLEDEEDDDKAIIIPAISNNLDYDIEMLHKAYITNKKADKLEMVNLDAGKMYLIAYIATGCLDWYVFNVANWGSKWNATETQTEETDEAYLLYFQTAWTPVINVVEKLSKRYGLDVYYQYIEPGCGFAGEMIYSDGDLIDEGNYDDGNLAYAEIYAGTYDPSEIKIGENGDILYLAAFEDGAYENITEEEWEKLGEPKIVTPMEVDFRETYLIKDGDDNNEI